MSKVDTSGQYVPFHGVTVVASAVRTENIGLLEELHLALSNCKSASNNFALLPVSSYHMTTMDLATEKSFAPGTFTTFIDNNMPWFRRLHQMLVEREFAPCITVDYAQVHGVIMLIVKLDEAQDSKLREIAKAFNIEEKIPPAYHITFGYRFKPMSSEELKQLEIEVNSLFDAVFTKRNSRQLVLDATKLCYFNDMCAFIPWDADTNPF